MRSTKYWQLGLSLLLAMAVGCGADQPGADADKSAEEVQAPSDATAEEANPATEAFPAELDPSQAVTSSEQKPKRSEPEPSTLDAPTLDDPADDSLPTPGGKKPADDAGPALVTAAGEKVAKRTTHQIKEKGLIPRSVLFGNPEKATARISSDGKRLAYLAPVDGVLNVWVGPISDPAAAKPITQDKKRGIRRFFWAYTNQHILYMQDADGDENWRIYRVDVDSRETKDLTPLEGVQAQIEAVSHRFPNEILIGLNNRKPQLHDIYRVNLTTGERKLIQENPGMAGFLTDEDYNVRFAVTFTPDAGQLVLKPDGKDGWTDFIKISSTDAMTTSPAGFDKSGEKLYFIDSRNRNTSALTEIDLATEEQKLIAADPMADVGGMIVHPTEMNVQAVSFTFTRREWKILDDSIAPDLEYLKGVEDGEIQVTSRSLDDQHWTVAYIVDDGPVKFYYYDRANRKANFLFASRRDLDDYQLAKMHPNVIKSRDGLQLVSYLTLPVDSDTDGDGRPEHPLPMVLNVHGGPWARDSWGYNAQHQWLANRGYAVLSVNYRGSTGFGKEFINAANGEWAGKMHEDLLDAVDWAVEQKIADREKVAIMGGSYGGYATLVGLTFTPKVFACGIDIVGPSSLVTLLNNVPPYWAPFMPVMKERVGDHTTEAGQTLLLEKSPLPRVEQIVRPLLIGQGANDPRVTQLEADQIVKAMQDRKIPVTYCLFPDEGHGFARPENRMAFNAVAEAFLAEHLGGKFEPIGGAFEGSSIEVPAGKNEVPELAETVK